MSQENIKNVHDANAAFNRGDLDSWIEFFDPEIEWHDLPALPGAGVYHGKEALRRNIEDLLETLTDFRVEIEEIESVDDDQVVARVLYTATGQMSGAIATPQPVSWVVDFRHGRTLRVRQFSDHSEALAAAGLSE